MSTFVTLQQQLNAKKKAKKKRKYLDSTLYDPTQRLAGKNLRHSIDELVGLQINPMLRDLEHERTNTEAQSGRITGNAKSYYDQLNAQQAALVGQARGINQDQVAAQGASNRSAQDAVSAMAAQAQQAQNADAAVRGNIATTAADQIASRLADTAASQANRNEADRLATAATTGAQGGLAVTNAQAGLQAGGEGINDLTDRFAKQLTGIRDKRLDVLAQRPALKAKTTQDLRDSEFDKLITMGGLNLKREDLVADTDIKKKTIKETNRHNSAMENNSSQANKIRKMQSDRQFGLDKDKFGYDKAKDRYQRRTKTGPYKAGGGKGGSGGSLTRTQENTQLDKIGSLRKLIAKGAKPDDLIASGESDLLTQVAQMLHQTNGKLTKAMVKKLHKRGLHVGGRFKILDESNYAGPN